MNVMLRHMLGIGMVPGYDERQKQDKKKRQRMKVKRVFGRSGRVIESVGVSTLAGADVIPGGAPSEQVCCGWSP